MRIRTIKPSFWGSPTIAPLSRDARLVAIGLMSYADDDGRFLAIEVKGPKGRASMAQLVFLALVDGHDADLAGAVGVWTAANDANPTAPTEKPWGLRIDRVEVKDVALPESMKRSLTKLWPMSPGLEAAFTRNGRGSPERTRVLRKLYSSSVN